jgi:hypothetical protein
MLFYQAYIYSSLNYHPNDSGSVVQSLRTFVFEFGSFFLSINICLLTCFKIYTNDLKLIKRFRT